MSCVLQKNALDGVSLFREMVQIRRFEERTSVAYGMGLIGGFCHLYIGQEAVIVGINSVKQSGDQMTTSYRDHGHILVSGCDPKPVMCELFGKANGVSKGKGGSMHLFDTANHFYGGHGIVGAQVPIGTGIGFANKYRKNSSVSIVFLGDGAVNQGQVYEAFNMAKLWGLPVLYIIENNEYGMGTSIERSCSTTDLYNRGQSFGIEGKQVNGMDLFSVIEASKDALEHIRTKQTPYILEMKTYRYKGHSMSDPANYRTRDEVDDYKKRDPINVLKSYLVENSYASAEELTKIDKEISAEMKEVVEFAKNSPLPDEAELYTQVFV